MTSATPVQRDSEAIGTTEARRGFRFPRRDRALEFVQAYGLVMLWLVMLATFSILLPDSFPTQLNFRNIVGNRSVSGIVSIAAIIPLIGGQVDFSMGSVLGFTTIATATSLSRFGAPVWLAATIGIGFGAIIGLLNGFLVARLGLNSIITTLGIGTALVGAVSWYTRGISIVTGIPASLTSPVSGTFLGLPTTIYYLGSVSIVVWYVLEHTPYGRHLRAVGSNANAARLAGINVGRITITSFVVEGVIVGFAGVLLVARNGGGHPGMSIPYTIPVLSATFLGATSITPGRPNVLGTIVGIFFMASVVSGLSLLGVDNWVESLFNGVALLTAVTLSTFVGWRRTLRG